MIAWQWVVLIAFVCSFTDLQMGVSDGDNYLAFIRCDVCSALVEGGREREHAAWHKPRDQRQASE